MKKFFGRLILVLVLFASPAFAGENCVCVKGEVEFFFAHKKFDPPKIERLQIFSFIKRKNLDGAVINFFDRFFGTDLEKAQVNVKIVTLTGEAFEGAARINAGEYSDGLARAVKNALKSKGFD